jgi:hypothetical protein
LFLRIVAGANLWALAFIERGYWKWDELEGNMAAFCTCCGLAITLKSMACPVCGAPSHGMKARESAPLGASFAEEGVEDRAVDTGLTLREAILAEEKKAPRQCVGCFAV